MAEEGCDSSGEVLLRTVSLLCQQHSTTHTSCVIRDIGAALERGESLTCRRLGEAQTNASFKVWLKGREKDLSLFAKQAFLHALWQLDKSIEYDIQRTENEALAMKQATQILLDHKAGLSARVCCPTVCFCVNVHENDSKILVTEWVNDAEPLANQFLDGNVDIRVVRAVGLSLALLNLAPFKDPHFNDGVRPMMRSCWPEVVKLFEKRLVDSTTRSPRETDRCQVMMEQIRLDGFRTMMDKVDEQYMKKEVFGHGDAHVFNILVEHRSKNGLLSSFGHEEEGKVVFCDWETSFIGSKGRDIGFFQGFPLACALCHAISGSSKDKTDAIIQALGLFWSCYAAVLVQHHKDPKYILETFRSFLGWTGLCLFPTYYLMKLFTNVWPLNRVSAQGKREALASMGVLGLKTMKWGFCNDDPDLTLERLQFKFNEALSYEVQHLSSFHEQQHG